MSRNTHNNDASEANADHDIPEELARFLQNAGRPSDAECKRAMSLRPPRYSSTKSSLWSWGRYALPIGTLAVAAMVALVLVPRVGPPRPQFPEAVPSIASRTRGTDEHIAIPPPPAMANFQPPQHSAAQVGSEDSGSRVRGGSDKQPNSDGTARAVAPIPPPIPSQNVGKNWVAVVVGVDKPRPSTGLSDLRGAVNDALRVSEALTAAGVTVHTLVPGGRAEPTFGNIIAAISAAASSAKGGNFLFYFSGHGVSINNTAYLIASDTTVPTLTGISLSTITGAATKTPGPNAIKTWVLIADVCKASAGATVPDVVEALKAGAKNWIIMTGAGPDQTAHEVDKFLPPGIHAYVPEMNESHGLFTYSLLTGRYAKAAQDNRLVAEADGNVDGVLTWREIFAYASERTQRRSLAQFSGPPQSPQIYPLDAKILDTPFVMMPQKGPVEKPGAISAAQIRPVPVDPLKEFVVYRDLTNSTKLPFEPYAWMWGSVANKMVVTPALVKQVMDVNPLEAGGPSGGGGTCVKWTVNWQGNGNGRSWDASWAAIGWFAGPDVPPWWAADGDNRGWYYNLQSPKKYTELRFFARSPQPGTMLVVKVGVLSRDQENSPLTLGDSLAYPISSRDGYRLDERWREYVLKLDPVPTPEHNCSNYRIDNGACQICGSSSLNPKNNNLERTCSLAFIVERYGAQGRDGQPNPNAPVEVYLDEIRFR